MAGVIKGFRASILGHQPVDWVLLGISAFIIFSLLASGLFYFRRMEKVFADVV
jgi:lipopolysaccharide transport system permease protein